MEPEKVQESVDQNIGLRRSARCNKGIPARRYSKSEMAAVDLCTNVPSSSVCVKPRRKKGCMSDTEITFSANGLPVAGNSDNIVTEKTAELVSVNENPSVRERRSSKGSVTSNISKLNLELIMLKEQQKIDEEEEQGRKKALERKRLNLIKEMELKKKIMDSIGNKSEIASVYSQSLYSDEHYLDKWVEDSKKCITPESSHSQENRERNGHEKVESLCSCTHKCCNNNISSVGCGGRDDSFFDVARQCIENTTNTNKLLLRQKVRDLTTFSGELSEWPIFISEFHRATTRYGLTDEDNLVRLERSLKGKARETVKALLTFPSNVAQIIKMLEMNFGRAEWIILELIEKVKRLGSVKEDKLESCVAFSNAVNNMVTTMKNVNAEFYLYNPELLCNLVEKLSPIQKYSWGKYKHQRDLQSIHTSLNDFANWFEGETNSLAGISNPFQKIQVKSFPRRENVMISKKSPQKNQSDSNYCVLCKNVKHTVQKCDEFLKKTITERRKSAMNLKLCFLCLQTGHMVKNCHQKNKCGENGCKGRHNKLLHVERNVEEPKAEVEVVSSRDFCGNLSENNTAEKTVLMRIAPVKLRGPTGEIQTFALFDEGSTCSMIEEELADKLKLSGPIVPLCFQWTNNISHYEDDSRLVSLDISGADKKSIFYKMNQVRTVRNLSLPYQKIDANEIKSKFPYLDLKVLQSIESASPQLLIGQDNYGLIVPRKIIQPKLNEPIMSKSKLGWTINGNITNNEVSRMPHVSLCCRLVSDEELHLLVKDSFRIDSFGVKQNSIVKSAEDKKAIDIMKKTFRRMGQHYEIGHLWKNENASLPDSRPNAVRRLLCMERKMDKDSTFSDEYCGKIEEYLNKGYAKILTDTEKAETPKTWYLPHFAVWNVNKPGKIRLVFDAAAKSYGSCLNDFLLQGPDFVPSLISVLWRFRQGKIAFSGDICEMFHQVLIRQKDQCAQRFLWRGRDRSRDPDVYQMNVMIFGAVSSPSKAQFVKNRNAREFECQFPGIIRCMEKQHYVDDYLDSCETEEEAIKRVADVIYVHERGGFEMTKWISNSENVMASIPKRLRSPTMDGLKIDSQKVERVLGLSWLPETDNFIFSLNLKKIPPEISSGKKIPTKREVLRLIMSIFDPLGFLAPLIIKGRILMQEIWRSGVDWDTEITETLFLVWKKWLMELETLSPIIIPRHYFPSTTCVKEVDLHIFCDSSDKAYATAAYLRYEVGNEIFTSFVSSKFKVAPLNQQTVPRLELQGAVLGCRLGKTICNELEYKIRRVHYWIDSMVVLKQIESESRRFPIFVACRIGEIRDETDISQWHWIPSDLNVADQATKELNKIDLGVHSKWLKGPKFLKLPEEVWPKKPEECSEKNIENILTVFEHKKVLELPEIDRFSKWIRLIRSTAWILHFKKIFNIPKKNRPREAKLDVDTLEEASKLWLEKSQGESFEEEISLLTRKKIIPKSSRLFKLSAFLDETGIIRLGGRFPESESLDLGYDFRYPVILDPKNKYTQLLINHYHHESSHNGVETVINNLRLKYWILHIRQAVKKCFNACLYCKIRKCKPIAPEMGLLPPERLESNVFPFTYVGIDFFGPMTISIGRRREKRYGVLFTCLTIRAVHIEVAASLDTSSTILAIRRFMCRRGQPKEIRSDNGTNFVGAERELRGSVKSLDDVRISDELSSRGIKWKFNCPSAPSMGGIWERMVRSIKTALKVSLKEVNPKEEVLLTLLYEAEYMVNSRPLTHISVDPNEPEAITPNHFLLLRPGGVQSHGENDIRSRKQWRFAQALADHYWKRWIQEYRPTLVQRQKWHTKTEPLKVGDITIIVDDKAPRNEWLLGRVEETYPGKDGTIRVAKIKTMKGSYTRPLTKLCVLPTSTS